MSDLTPQAIAAAAINAAIEAATQRLIELNATTLRD